MERNNNEHARIVNYTMCPATSNPHNKVNQQPHRPTALQSFLTYHQPRLARHHQSNEAYQQAQSSMQIVEQNKEEHAPPPEAQNITKNPIPSRGMIIPIVGGSSANFENKKQRKSYFKRVHAILPGGPVVKTHW